LAECRWGDERGRQELAASYPGNLSTTEDTVDTGKKSFIEQD
jgi:hypothetical protein